VNVIEKTIIIFLETKNLKKTKIRTFEVFRFPKKRQKYRF